MALAKDNYRLYRPEDIAPKADGTTRFALDVTPAGQTQQRGLTALTIWEQLLQDRIKESQPLQETVVVNLKRILRLNNGTYVLADLSRPVSFTRAFAPRHTQKHLKHEDGGGWIDTLLLSETGFAQGRDEYVWESALTAAGQLNLRGHALTRLSLLACQLVLCRSGAPKSLLRHENIPL